MQPITHINEQKMALLELLMPLCPFIAVDATQPGVEVPKQLRSPQLVLRIGRDERVMGMPDLKFDEHGWAATIALSGVRHYVIVPWEACSRYWISDPFVGPGIVWFTAEVHAQGKTEAKKTPNLRLVQEEP